MQLEGIFPDATTFVCGLKACGLLQDVGAGQRLHIEIARQGASKTDVEISNALIDMYSKCGELTMAQEVFDSLKVRNLVSWNSLMTCYNEQGHEEQALASYELMLCTGLVPNSVTFICVLKACSSVGIPYEGQMIHAHIVKTGLLYKHNGFVGNAIINLYAKCGTLAIAREVFDTLPKRDVVSWNVLIAGYAQHRYGQNALTCFNQMQLEGIFPDATTFVCGLKACGLLQDVGAGQRLHIDIARQGASKTDVEISNALIDMYSKCGELTMAQEVFDSLKVRNLVSWNSLMTCYMEQGHEEQALASYELMLCTGLVPNSVTFICVLKACSSVGIPYEGQMIHAHIVKTGLLESDCFIETTLVDMYLKCLGIQAAEKNLQ
ncbi:hypothetical protein KP509_18G062800 [Ceratopteris richardii]|uniref:Pentatricopeptide repeat-containing protein n=1 Tax=Ceratopteris richardii TaxID=49495 RepID=A0A8T2SRQ5_CERRI|nr:hypothetical protein KP509_18G062800 [Ceratopteris richardii]